MARLKGAIEAQTEVIKQTASIIPFVIKTLIIGGIGYYVYSKYTNRFKPMQENKKYPTANVTAAQAQSRSQSILASDGYLTNDFDAVANALAGLNYNGFIRVYNAFGHQDANLLNQDLDLILWIKAKFSESEVSQLGFLLNNVFF